MGYCNTYQSPYIPLGPYIPTRPPGHDENARPIYMRGQRETCSGITGTEMGPEIDFEPYAADDEDEPSEPAHSYTHIHTGDRILTLRIPYLGPVGWTVPAREGSQATRPFLIYQDPTAGYLSPPLPAGAGKPIDEHINLLASDDKENIGEDIDEGEEEEDSPDRDAYVQDNMVAEAENIIELAAMNDGWNVRALRNRLQQYDDQGGYGYGYGHGNDGNPQGLEHQYWYGNQNNGYGYEFQQYHQRPDNQPEVGINVALGGSLEASPVRSQRANSSSVVVVSPPRGSGRANAEDGGSGGRGRWNGSPRTPSGFF
ncbi:hypothetical protein AJ79_07634 [Helicocarpus griseus UAMH5409]|uniref:Uncharacterized protein n=1 Tax=Helicocarpus griseus UAMH5409 TaxID=1447875 RepID=A0A2B7X106_9EURO|nr:hypothetical protein AJ79_07634 [Helicocarpus griseus UAMH5409]